MGCFISSPHSSRRYRDPADFDEEIVPDDVLPLRTLEIFGIVPSLSLMTFLGCPPRIFWGPTLPLILTHSYTKPRLITAGLGDASDQPFYYGFVRLPGQYLWHKVFRASFRCAPVMRLATGFAKSTPLAPSTAFIPTELRSIIQVCVFRGGCVLVDHGMPIMF